MKINKQLYHRCLLSYKPFIMVLYLLTAQYMHGQDNGTIILNQTISEKEVFVTATQKVTFKPGFRATASYGTFNAKIGNSNLLIPSIETAPGSTTAISTTPSNDQNYIKATRYTSADGRSKQIAIQYIDGFGRLKQSVAQQDSPEKADLVSLIQYDGIDREARNWLPVPVSGNHGMYVSESSFINTSSLHYNDSYSYSETKYEQSPLNRIEEQYGAGAVWYNNEKPVKTDYGTNSFNEVRYFYINSNNQLQCGGLYSSGNLYKTVTTDEDGKTITEFKDKLGRLILSRQFNTTNHDTYYVYDSLGNLCYVLPPLAADVLLSGIYSDTHTTLRQYAYIYKYDDRNRQIIKYLPGCEPVYMVYDKSDRLIMSQDGNQRVKEDSRGRFTFTLYKYDELGRQLYSSEMYTFAGADYWRTQFKDKVITESYIGTSIVNPDRSIPSIGYSLGWFYGDYPMQLLSVNYHDNYDFLNISADINFEYDNSKTEYGKKHDNAKGLLTGTRTYLLDGSGSYIQTVYYYDSHGQVVQTRSNNQLGGYDFVYNQYNFSGNVTQSLNLHTTNSSYEGSVMEIYKYTYDHAGRLIDTKYKLDNNAEILLATNKYDELGRLKEKRQHNNKNQVQYQYNIRNWLTQIQDGDFKQNIYYNENLISHRDIKPYFNGNISMTTWTYKDREENYKYTYDKLNRLEYTHNYAYGNLWSRMEEVFTYDKNGNIKQLLRLNDNNISEWEDYPDYEFNDILRMAYNGNQLMEVSDMEGSQNLFSVKEYHDLNSTENDFAYDANGNMTKDLDRDIVTIRYNLLNLPEIVQFRNGNQIKNTYTADGRKLRSEYYTAYDGILEPISVGNIRDCSIWWPFFSYRAVSYANNKEYDIRSHSKYTFLETTRIHNSEGYMQKEYEQGGTGAISSAYNYYRKDHLGNNREVWTVNGNNVATIQRTQYYASGLPWAEGEGASEQPYKYNGKEFIEMHGYDTYDYGARGYYPAIMRFMTIDPLAEKYYNISPYAYCGNNPVNRIDPDGRDWYSYEEDEEDENGVVHTRTRYKYVEGQMSKKEMKEGGYTHLGKTHVDGDMYYTLFGQKADLKTEIGLLYQKVDEAIINYAEEKIRRKNQYVSTNSWDTESFDNYGYTDFAIDQISGKREFSYEGSYSGIYINFTGKGMNNARMINWIGDSNMPMDIGAYIRSGSVKKSYHIRFQNRRNGDPVHLKYNKEEAMILLRKYHNLFPELK